MLPWVAASLGALAFFLSGCADQVPAGGPQSAAACGTAGRHELCMGGPGVPFFSDKRDSPPVPCDAAIFGAGALTADGVMCVCEKGPNGGGAWALFGTGGACWPHQQQ